MFRTEMELNDGDRVTITYMNVIRTYRIPTTGRYSILGHEIEVNGKHVDQVERVDGTEPGLYPISGAV